MRLNDLACGPVRNRAWWMAGVAVAASLATACVACPPPDFDNSGEVNGADLGVLLGAWSTPEGDLNGDLTTDGADLGVLLAAWGDCPPTAPLACIEFGRRLLADDGTFVMVDVLSEPFPLVEVDAPAFGGAFTVEQEPPAGSLIEGAGTVPVMVTVLGKNGYIESCTFPLELLDVTPPVVSLLGVEDGQELVAPTEVSPWFEVHDTVSPEPDILVEFTIDGKPAVPGEVVSAVGHHTVAVTATDAAGNTTDRVVTFLIRPRPVVDAIIAIESLSCDAFAGPDGFVTLDAVVLVASLGAPIADLDISSVALWPLDSAGVPLNKGLLHVAGSTDPAGFYSYATAEAMYQQGYWRIHFHAEVAESLVVGCPSGFLVTGRSGNSQPNAWDLDRFAPAVVDWNAVGTLARSGALNSDPPASPPAADPCPACEWKEKWDPTPDACDEEDSNACNAGTDSYRIDALAGGAHLERGGHTYNNCQPANDWGDSCTALGSGNLLVWLEGRPACCQPSISVSLQPAVETKCQVIMTATATISPTLDEKSDCGNAAAKASGTHTRNAEGSDERLFTQSDLKACNAAMATVSVTSNLSVDVKAKKTHAINTAFAKAAIKRARGRITVNAVCAGCANSPLTVKQGF